MIDLLRSTALHVRPHVLPSLPSAAARPGHRRAGGGDHHPAGMEGGGERTRKHRRRRRTGDRRCGQHFDIAESGPAHERPARSAARLADGGVFRGILQEPPRSRRCRSHAAADQLARLRLHHRCVRPGRHQQSRHRRRRRDQRHPQRRHQAPGRTRRQGFEERPGAAARASRQAAEGGEVRRFRQAAARRVGHRHRQSVQPRRHGDRRHRLGAQPRHQFRALRQLHPDRRRHQSRQFRRAAVQPQQRGRRRQHRDHFAVRRLDRHRLRGAVELGARGHRPAPPVRRDPARLARRPHPAGHRQATRTGKP